MTAYYNENNAHAAAWLRELIKRDLIAPGDVDERDIWDVRPSDVAGYDQCHFFAGIGGWSYALRLAGWPDDKPVWTGSCPCQPFSAAGEGRGFADKRHLWPAFKHLIGEHLPSVVFGEQVATADRHGWLDLVQDDLEGIQYAFGSSQVPACSVGANHIRQRIWWVADSVCRRFQKSRELRENPCDHATSGFRETDRMVDAIRRGSLPYVCGCDDGIPEGVSRIAIQCLGNAIVPQVAAKFIEAFMSIER